MTSVEYLTALIKPLCIDSYCEFAIIESPESVSAFFDDVLQTCYVVIKGREPIYVGYTSDINSRLREHEYADFKFGYYDRLVLIGYDSKEDALNCERQLIKNLNQDLNVIRYTGRNRKEINGKRVQVKYKAFRLPLDLIKEMGIYSASKNISLEDIAYNAINGYLKEGFANERL